MARILLSDSYGLTSRQVAGLLGRAGHNVEVLGPPGVTLTGLTRWVRRTHTVPPFGDDPFAWYEAAIRVLEENRFDVLLPVQEEITMLARHPERLHAIGTGVAIPPFESLKHVQNKLASVEVLRGLGLPQPPTDIAADFGELMTPRWRFPVFVKLPIGTASTGVYRVEDAAALRRLGPELVRRDAFDHGGVLVQQLLPGPLAMIVSVFDQGQLVGWHACERVREGLNGGAISKRSITLPQIADHLERLGGHLQWHGALALDAILYQGEPHYIDVNPRLVEPANAQRAGADLLRALLDVSAGNHPAPTAPGRPGVVTHQLVLAVLNAATMGRRHVLPELAAAILHTGRYRGSAEELTPLYHDPISAVPVIRIAATVLAHPERATAMATGTVRKYSLSPGQWERICESPLPNPGNTS
jgi:predicted ATP-grasp superfamily ATP-dependent carboligase